MCMKTIREGLRETETNLLLFFTGVEAFLNEKREKQKPSITPRALEGGTRHWVMKFHWPQRHKYQACVAREQQGTNITAGCQRALPNVYSDYLTSACL